MNNQSDNNSNNGQDIEYPFSYDGNVVWPILFLFIWPPLGIILLMLNLTIKKDGYYYSLYYHGSQFWLLFWTILFFPVAVVLAAIQGFNIRKRPVQ